MFDRLIHHSEYTPVFRRDHRLHAEAGWFIAAGFIAGIVFTVWGIGIDIAPPSFAQQRFVDIRIIDQEKAQQAVMPLHNFPLIKSLITVQRAPVSFSSANFILDGAYDPDAIESVTLVMDGVQIGDPVIPDTRGVLTFRSNNFMLTPGDHMFSLLISTRSMESTTIFHVLIDPHVSFLFGYVDGPVDAFVHPPFETQLLSVVKEGTVSVSRESSVAMEKNAAGARVAFSVEAEDFFIDQFDFDSSIPMTGARIDVFCNDELIGTAPFEKSHAVLTLTDQFLRIVRDKQNSCSMLLAGDLPSTNKPYAINLTSITVRGIQSSLVQTVAGTTLWQ